MYDTTLLEPWVLSQLLIKSPNLTSLTLDNLSTSAETLTALLDFMTQVCDFSQCLKSLHIESTKASPEQCEKYLTEIADSGLTTLESLTIQWELLWKDHPECFVPFQVILGRQTGL